MSVWTALPPFGNAINIRPSVPVVAVANMKGGVGKTTLTANLACSLAYHFKKRVLAIDLDFQGSLSEAMSHLVHREFRPGAANLFKSKDPEIIFDVDTVTPGFGKLADLHIVQSFYDLADIEDRLLVRMMLNGDEDEDIRYMVAKKLSSKRVRDNFDLVLIDTPPRLTSASINALCACTHVLIPTQLTDLAASGTIAFKETLKRLQDVLCPRLNIMGVVPTLTRQTGLTESEKSFLSKLRNDLLHVDVWHDLNIPRRQSLADNKNYFNVQDIRDIFDPIAERVVIKVGLFNSGPNAGVGTSRGAQTGWDRLSH